MKRMIADAFLILYKITKSPLFSYLFAQFYISALSFVILYGLTFLLKDVYPPLEYVFMAFKFPFNIATALLVFFVNYSSAPMAQLTRDKKKNDVFYWPVVIFSAAGIAVAAYFYYLRRVPENY